MNADLTETVLQYDSGEVQKTSKQIIEFTVGSIPKTPTNVVKQTVKRSGLLNFGTGSCSALFDVLFHWFDFTKNDELAHKTLVNHFDHHRSVV